MKKGWVVGFCAILCVLMFAMTAFADWKETGRDKWRIIYVDDEIQSVGQDTFVLREKKEYISEGPRCSCAPHEAIIQYTVDTATCRVQAHDIKAVDEDGNIVFAQSGGELAPEFALAPYCKIALANAARTAEIKQPAANTQLASASLDSGSIEPIRP